MNLLLSQTLFTSLCFFLIGYCSAQVYVSFSIYPPASINCLHNAAEPSGCPLEALTLQDINSCLCGNGGHFIDNTAICLHNGDSADTQDVWNTMVAPCDESGTPVVYSESLFLSVSDSSPAAVQSSVSSTATQSRPPTTAAQSSPVGTTTSPAEAPASPVVTPSSPVATPSPAVITSKPSSSVSKIASSDNSNNNGNSVGGLSGGMIALIGTIAGVGCFVIALAGCCCSCGGRNKIEKVVKQTLRQHLMEYRAPEHTKMWTDTGYD